MKEPFLKQSTWRVLGALAIAGAALMAWIGAGADFQGVSLWLVVAYWGGVLLLLALAGFTVLLDIRYIRLQYALGRREVFRQTLGDETFRKVLIEGQRAGRDKPPEAHSS